MDHIVAKIYRPKNMELVQADGVPLEIGGKIGFLRDILLRNSDFVVDKQGDWILQFFINKDYKQTFIVKFFDLTDINDSDIKGYLRDKDKKLQELEGLSIATCIGGNVFDSRVAERLSLSVRGSKAIKKEDYFEGGFHSHYIDGKGLSFFSGITEKKLSDKGEKIDSSAQFKRYVLLLSLAYAYLGVAEHFGNTLASCLTIDNSNQPSEKTVEKLQNLYIEMARFSAIFLFRQPVKLSRSSLVHVWQTIDDSLCVNNTAEELFSKLANIHYILNVDKEGKLLIKEKEQQKKQDRINITFTIIGIIISLVGLLELFK